MVDESESDKGNMSAAQPLTTLPYSDFESLLNWESFSKTNTKKHVTPFRKWKKDYTKPKTLLCHDMKGGYLEDRYDQGFPSNECFHFHHWHLIDTFCYFSHSFVTVPPVSWINAAHQNGVKVLGTVITEWDDGKKNLKEVLKSHDSVKKTVDSLVGLALAFDFEGWLVNIEVEIEEEQVSNLLYFVEYLTKEMHKCKEDSVVIWYDSVISNGKLKWQNKLCKENKLFFDVCDGIFLNYNWSPQHLQHSIKMAGEQRRHDVYVGIDVFGRGCLGGGGWNTCQAMEVIRQHNLSAAIFAFGWIYEKLGVENFRRNNEKFWELLSNYLHPHIINELPLVTSFCRGYGDGFYSNGKKILNRGWYNLNLSSPQPTYSSNFHCPDIGIEITDHCYHTEEAFGAGGCIKITGKVTSVEKKNVLFRLFKSNLTIKKEKSPELFISYSYNCKHGIEVNPSLLLVQDSNKEDVLSCSNNGKVNEENFASFKTQEHNGWITRSYTYKIKKDEISVTAIDMLIEANDTGNFEFLLGDLKVCYLSIQDGLNKKPTISVKSPEIYPLVSTDNNHKFNILLSWDSLMWEKLNYCDVYWTDAVQGMLLEDIAGNHIEFSSRESGVFLGRTKSPFYQICSVIIPRNCCDGKLSFSIVAWDIYGKCSRQHSVRLSVSENLLKHDSMNV